MQKEKCLKGCLSCCRSGVTLTSNKECAFVLRQVSPDLQKPQRDGFTLIELLVVVLIIGILAAVALPQYQKAVEKARLINLLTLMKSVADAQEAYYLANGQYATALEELSIDLPAGATPTGTFYTLPKNQTIGTNDVGVLYGGNQRFQIDWVMPHATWVYPSGVYCAADQNDALGLKICESMSRGGERKTVGCGILNLEYHNCYMYPIVF